MVVSMTTMEADGPVALVRRDGKDVCQIRSLAASPLLRPRVAFMSAGARGVRTAVLFPHGTPPERPLPVVLDPYGGPPGPRGVGAPAVVLGPPWLGRPG